MKLDEIILFLRNVKDRKSGPEIIEKIEKALNEIKADYVKKDDQLNAKNIWCYERILNIQVLFIEAFEQMKSKNFFDSWRTLENCEKLLENLTQHFSIDENDDEYYLNFIEKNVRKFQSLFPYKLFMSTEILYNKQECSICGKEIRIRDYCGHEVGEIYDGKMCTRIIQDFELGAVALTDSPRYKYTVLFPSKDSSGETIPDYDYRILEYLLDALKNPFDLWDYGWTEKLHSHSNFKELKEIDECPCGSGAQYGICCQKKPGVLMKHIDFKILGPIPTKKITFL